MQAAARGDDAAFHALIDRHAKPMFRVAMSMSHNRADAEDLMQDTFVGAYRGINGFDGRSSVKTWLMSILTRQAAKGWHRGRHNRATQSIHASEDKAQRQDSAMQTQSPTSAVEHRLDVMQVLHTL